MLNKFTSKIICLTFFSLFLLPLVNAKPIEVVSNDVSLTHSCTVYKINIADYLQQQFRSSHFPNLLQQTYFSDLKALKNSFNVTRFVEVYGKLKNVTIYMKVNQTYEVKKPIYEEVTERMKCNETRKKIGNNTYQCGNLTMVCNSVKNKTYYYNTTKITGYTTETKWKEKWVPIRQIDWRKKKWRDLEIPVLSPTALKDILRDKVIYLKVCGDYDFSRTPNGWGVSIDHIPSFFGVEDPSLTWWNASWQYRRPITISEQSGNTLTDYQVKLTIDTASLISSGKMNSDCSDMRFTYYDGSTEQEIPYWIESGCNSDNTIVWVKVPEIPANSQTTIYIYYGNPSATSESNGDDVFILFDDFEGATIDTNKWNTYQRTDGSITVENSLLKLDNSLIISKNYQITDGIIETKVKIISKEGSMFARASGNTGDQFESSYGLHSGDFGADNTWNLAITQDNSRQFTDTTQAILNEWLLLRFTLNGNSLKGERFKYVDMSPNGGPVEGTLTKYSSGYIGLRVDGGGNGDRISYYDWVRVRKYASTEPTYTIGSEEISNQPPSVSTPKIFNSISETNFIPIGQKMTIRVNVTDPDGASDLDKVLITIIDNQSNVVVNNETMTQLTSITNGYTYKYNYTIPSSGASGLWTIKVYANDTQNAWGYNETTVTVTMDLTPPTITFISQTPSNLNVSSTDPVSIIVNITDESGIDTSKIAFFNGVNHTLTSSFYHYNWTWRYPANDLQPDMRRADNRNMSYWFENVVFKENPDDIWTFAGYDPTMGEVNIIENESTYVTLNVTFFSAQMMFPQVFPFDKQYLTAENKTGKYVELCKNAWLKIRFHPKVFYNYTTENYTVYIDLDIDPSFTPNQQPLDIYFCNSSYISGDPGSSPYCSYVDHITSADERKIKINQSSYIQKVFSTHDGYVDGVAVSDTAYFVLKTNVPEEKSFRLYYANESVNQYINFSAFNNAWLSTDQGSSWSLTDWTPDFYLISTQAERDKVMYYVYACDVAGNCANSTIQYDSLDPANHPPNAPLIEAPKENETITGLYNITWYAIGDPDFDNYNYTIYLCNPDGSINDTIVADQPAQLFKYNYSYEFNSSVYPTGNYRINITLCDSHGACSSSITPYNFTIYHTYSETSTQALKISNIPQLISHQLTKSFQPLTIPSIASLYASQKIASPQAFTLTSLAQLISHQFSKSTQSFTLPTLITTATHTKLSQPFTLTSLSTLHAFQKISSIQSLNIPSLASIYASQKATASQPFTLSHLLKILTASHTSQEFSITHLLTTSTHLHQPQKINIIDLASTYAFQKAFTKQTFSLTHAIKTLTGKNVYLKLILPTAVSHISHYFISIPQLLQMLLEATGKAYPGIVTIELPNGNTYGQNETVLVTGWVGTTNGNPYPYSTVYLYYYNTSEGISSAKLWAQTTTNATGYYNFTWYNETIGNFTLYVNTTKYKYNSTTVEIVNPIKEVIDKSPTEWYYYSRGEDRSYYTALLDIKTNVNVSKIDFTSSGPLQPFYISQLNGGYSNCTNVTSNDTCGVAFRYTNIEPGNQSFTINYNITYPLGNFYSSSFKKYTYIKSTYDMIKATKLKTLSYSYNFPMTYTHSPGSCTNPEGHTVDYYPMEGSSSDAITVNIPTPYKYAIIKLHTSADLHVRLYVSTNGGSYSDRYSDATCGSPTSATVDWVIVAKDSDIKNVSFYVSYAKWYTSTGTKPVPVSVSIYLTNDTYLRSFPTTNYVQGDTVTVTTFEADTSLEYYGLYTDTHYQSYTGYPGNSKVLTYTYLNGNKIVGHNWGNWRMKGYLSSIKDLAISSSNKIEFESDSSVNAKYIDGYYVAYLKDLSFSCNINSTLPSNYRGDNFRIYLFTNKTYNLTCYVKNVGYYNLEEGNVTIKLPPMFVSDRTNISLPSLNPGSGTYITYMIRTPTDEVMRGFGLDSIFLIAQTMDGGFGITSLNFRLLPTKHADIILNVPDRVQAGGLFSIYSTFTPKDYSMFYPHYMFDLAGTFGFETGISSAKLQTGYTSGRCFDITIWTSDYEPGVGLAYTQTDAGTVFSSDSLQMVPQHKFYIYDESGFLNKSTREDYEIGRILTGYGVLEPGDWKMYGVYDYIINGFSAEAGTIYSDWNLGHQFLYKFLDVTEVPQSFNIITANNTAVQIDLNGQIFNPHASQDYNWIAWYPKNFPTYLYYSGGSFYARTFPTDPSTYWIPCLSSGYAPLIPPFNVYIEYIKKGEDAFTIPAGQRLAIVDNQVVEPGQTAEGVHLKAIAPLKPGIYNITVIVWDDAETGLYWTATKQVRVVQYLPKSQIVVSQEDQPAEEVWAKQVGSDINVTMIRKVLVTNYEGFNDTQVSWVANPLPPDAVWINGSVAGTIDYICDGCTVNPSNITFKVPGVSYWYSIAFDSNTADLGSNVTGKINAYFYDNSTSTDFTNVKVNVTAMLLPDASTPTPTYTIDRIYTQQTIFRQFDWTSRTGYEKTWKIEKPNNYRYTATIHMYNNNSENLTVRYRIPLIRLPEFDPNRIISMSLDGENNLGYELTSTDLIILANNLTEGDHNFYLEYSPKPAVSLVTGGGAVGVAPNITVEPKHYNYTGKPTNFTAWFSVTCKDRACALIVVPSGPYSSWVEIPHEARYGWTTTGFLSIPRGATLVIPARVSIPEATPDGSYNITLLFSDIPTRVQTKAYIHLHITRKTPWEKYKPYIIIGLAIVILVVLVKLKIVRFK